MLGLHGAVAVFDAARDDWSEYIKRLEHYITANDIVSEDKQLHRGWTVDLPSNSIVGVASEGDRSFSRGDRGEGQSALQPQASSRDTNLTRDARREVCPMLLR